jgi:hypothetical protein
VSFVRLDTVDRFEIPSAVADVTDQALREVGAHGGECFVLWTGVVSESTFSAMTAYVPSQTAHQVPDGVCVTVDGDELHKLNRWLFEEEQTLGVQIHSHPTRAYHSQTDSTYPIVTQRGGLSLVVPYFGRDGIRGRDVAGYRLDTHGWRHLRRRVLRRLVVIEADQGGRQ